jgi:hypothetical protein
MKEKITMNKITISTYWDLVGEDLENLIKWLHQAPMTTSNHYGRYIPILQDLKPLVGLGMAKALMIKAGANKQGVLDASRIF